MSLVLDQPHLIDTLRYRVYAQRRVQQDEVRISLRVTALVNTKDRDQVGLERRIREALGGVIKADWAFLNIERASDSVGYERVALWASARVPASENYDLAERCRKASQEGLAISSPRVDYALSRERVDAIVEELRLEILAKVEGQLRAFSEKTGRAWRIGDIVFGVDDDSSPLSRARSAKGAFREGSDEGLAFRSSLGEDEEPSGFGGAEKVYLVAAVALKAPV